MPDARPVAWVTGAGSGIGRAGALALARAGHRMALSGRQRAPLDAVADEIRSAGGEARVVPLDVAEAGAVAGAAAAIESQLGPVELLVNSAGINIARRAWTDLQPQDWRQIVDINLHGTFLCMQAVLAGMRALGRGLVINIASWAGRHPTAFVGPSYTASKQAVVALTHSFNMEQGTHGLRACVIMPGEVDTPILRHRPIPVPAHERARMLQEDDLGRTIAFVASMPAHVCVNEILISPTRNRVFAGAGDLHPRA